MEPGASALSRNVRVVALATLIGAIVLFRLLTAALAANVDPEFLEGSTNRSCTELARVGQNWKELKVDPPANRQKSDGTLTVTISNLTDTKTFDWSSNIGVDAVLVKAGSSGSYLYRYDDPTSGSDPGETTSDTGLTSPGAGTTNQISHISFCYDVEDGPSPSPSPSPTETETPSPTPTPTETETPSPTPTPTETETPTPTPTPTETETPTPTPTESPTESPTVLPTVFPPIADSPSPTTTVLGGQLGKTGVDLMHLVAIALMFIALGTGSYVVTVRSRRSDR